MRVFLNRLFLTCMTATLLDRKSLISICSHRHTSANQLLDLDTRRTILDTAMSHICRYKLQESYFFFIDQSSNSFTSPSIDGLLYKRAGRESNI
ncbi:uncharacterized protein HD556DRAFT_948678 [Suillus plorans]|uniref:Secreted protein n=1 Tax=Suillus plorans TaxID=116603 RepID=A0A9P7DCN9_9AGAM|nr:uncharacterized protein HD556DRAFT_948678 [Suillus plorans]KAG1787474.1 hypothetical protein HD556DRAFT_948678 [Suillus plorans]